MIISNFSSIRFCVIIFIIVTTTLYYIFKFEPIYLSSDDNFFHYLITFVIILITINFIFLVNSFIYLLNFLIKQSNIC